VANSSMGFINLTKFHQAGPTDLGGTGAQLGSTYLRVAGTFDMAGWDTGVGIQSWSGSSLAATATGSPVPVTTGTGVVLSKMDTKAWAIDGQMQGEMGGMPLGVYASYASAAGTSAGGLVNRYNANPNSAHAYTISADLGVMPEKATLEAGIRRGKNGAATLSTDNAYMIGGTYKLAQNMMAQLTYSHLSGDANSAANATTNQTVLNLTTLF